MASSHLQSADFMEELICSVCLELFIQPVILECGHNYCKTCIDNVWESEGTPKCPECRAPNPGKKYTLNRLLSRLVEKTQSLDLEDRLSPTLASPPANVSRDVQLCDAHGEGMKLFCEDCRCPACLVCKGSIKHRGHSFLPLQEAEQLQRQKYEHELKLMSSALESQLKILQHVQSKQEQKKTDIQNETQVLKQYISSEFAKMYKFLHEKEEYLIQQLRNEEAEILKDVEFSLAKVQEKAGAIQKEIAEIQSLLQQHGVDDIALLKATRNLIRKNQIEMQEDIDFKGHITSRNQRLGVFRGPLQYSVWKEMKSIISPAPALLLLDPETACRNLILSADLTSARYCFPPQTYSYSPKRFMSLLAVLGAERVHSGRHYWEVVVEDKTEWYVGVALESVQRQGVTGLKLDEGLWTLYHQKPNLYKAFDSPPVVLSLKKKPQKIGVYVDYEGGQVSFYDARDMSHLYTYTDTFTDVLRLYLNPCDNEFECNLGPLKLFHLKL